MTRSLSNLKKMILSTTLVLLPMASVSARAQQKANVNVPFAFVANQVSLPAGHYEVLRSDWYVTFINLDDRRTHAMLLIRDEPGDAIALQGLMNFYVIGGRHVLTEVQFAGSSMHSELLSQPKRERHIDNTKSRGGAIEIAMK